MKLVDSMNYANLWRLRSYSWIGSPIHKKPQKQNIPWKVQNQDMRIILLSIPLIQLFFLVTTEMVIQSWHELLPLRQNSYLMVRPFPDQKIKEQKLSADTSSGNQQIVIECMNKANAPREHYSKSTFSSHLISQARLSKYFRQNWVIVIVLYCTLLTSIFINLKWD